MAHRPLGPLPARYILFLARLAAPKPRLCTVVLSKSAINDDGAAAAIRAVNELYILRARRRLLLWIGVASTAAAVIMAPCVARRAVLACLVLS